MTDHWKLYEHGSYKGPVPANARGAEDPHKHYRARARARLAKMKQDKGSALFAAEESNREYRRRITGNIAPNSAPLASLDNNAVDSISVRAQARAEAKAARSALKSETDGVFSGINDSNAQYRSRIESANATAPTAVPIALPACDGIIDGGHSYQPTLLWLCASPDGFEAYFRKSAITQRCLHSKPVYTTRGSIRLSSIAPCKLHTALDIDVAALNRTVRAIPPHVVPDDMVAQSFLGVGYSVDVERFVCAPTLILDECSPQIGGVPVWAVIDGSHRLFTRVAPTPQPLSSTIEALKAVVKARQAILRHFDAVSKRQASALPTPKYMAEAGNDLFETAVAVVAHPRRPFAEVCVALGRAAGKSPESFAEPGNTLVNIGYARWSSPDDSDKSRAIVLSDTGKRAVKETLSELSATAAALNPGLARDVDAFSRAALNA